MSIDNGCHTYKNCDTCDYTDCRVNKQKDEIERLTEENAALSKGVKRLKKRYEETIKQNADECVKKFCETTMYAEQERLVKENAELQKQVDELKKRLHWIWAIGVDYDGCDKVESLKGLIDELVKITQMDSKEFVERYGVEVEE